MFLEYISVMDITLYNMLKWLNSPLSQRGDIFPFAEQLQIICACPSEQAQKLFTGLGLCEF